VLVLLLRLYYTTQLPTSSGDLLRHVQYAALVPEHGLSVFDQPLAAVDPQLRGVPWSNVAFPYPATVLLFDALLGYVLPSIFVFKLALTLLELLGSLLVQRITGERWLALIYWAQPSSIWWASHEGQFEPLQNILVLLALYLLARSRPRAWFVFALAVQVKLFGLLLAPYFISTLRWSKSTLRAMASFGAGLSVTLLLLPWFDYLANSRYSMTLSYNPFYWHFLRADMFDWHPLWLNVVNQLASSLALVAFLAVWIAGRFRPAYLAPLLFMIALKLLPNAQSWYLVMLPAFIVPFEDRRWRLWAMAALPLLDLRAVTHLFVGAWGWVEQETYRGLSAFTVLGQI